MSDEEDYLLSILGKKGYAAMDHWMPTDPPDKNNAGKLVNYLGSTLDDEISPYVRIYEVEDVKRMIDETDRNEIEMLWAATMVAMFLICLGIFHHPC